MTKVKKEVVRVRIAPSPTGYLHIGTARAALFNWLFARHKSEGKFILRIEDTDLERSEKRFEDDIISSLEWLGLKWDEFYKQSDRTKIYSKYIQKLLDDRKAFWCYHSEEELEKERQEQMTNKNMPRHVCSFRDNVDAADGRQGIIRLKIDPDSTRKISFLDVIRGNIEFEERLLGDVSIAKSVDVPLYHFAVVVDDYEMDITHVIRGEDHIANTPKQILLQEALGFEQPQYAHLPLILGPDRSKLSKRHASTSIAEYRGLGYLPDAIVNFLFLLGWTPDKSENEILTKNEAIEQFNLEKVHKAGAIFDIKKLNWINSQYIKMENDEGLAKLVQPFVAKHFGHQEKELIVKIAPLLRERLEYLDQVKEFHFFFKEPEYSKELLQWKSRSEDEVKNSLAEVKKVIEEIGTEDKSRLRQELDELGKRLEDRGLVYWPFRVSLTGEKASPDPVDVAFVLGKEMTLQRMGSATKKS
ncbi:MAG: glutamate--tRNA ligase [Candidatus Yanofskybacteria bacterium]|nr:glutamate--tRNA ligase [Candidatus Yanofskybacteria bacterium]